MMSAINDAKPLYLRYHEEYGAIPTRPEHFMAFCKKHGVKLRYKDCRQICENPPKTSIAQNDAVHHLLNHSKDESDEGEELKYATEVTEHSHTTQSKHIYCESKSISNSTSNASSTSNSTAMPPIAKQKSFTKLTHKNKCKPMTFSMDITDNHSNANYISPQILINKIIPINGNMNIMPFHRDLNLELNTNRCQYVFRDFIFFILYWGFLLNGFFDLYHFGLWYFRFICFFLWHCVLILTLFCHFRFKSPPLYPVYCGSDFKFWPYFDKSAVEYMKDISSLPLELKLFQIKMFGPLRESTCNEKNICFKKMEDIKSMDILDEITKSRNKLIRLRVFHIIRFSNSESYDKFINILKDMKSKQNHTTPKQMFYIEYNIEFKHEQRLLINTTNDMNHTKSFWNVWNYSCSNRNLSYVWYGTGFGFCYRFYHDVCIKTHVYDCVKEVTL